MDLDAFEASLCEFLIAREGGSAVAPRGFEDVVHGKSWSWIGLLFAVLACGCQFSDLPARDRELTSKLYSMHSVLTIIPFFSVPSVADLNQGTCAFECLRIMNFFLRPSFETIQTLLLLGSTAKNNRNPGISWSVLGMSKDSFSHDYCTILRSGRKA